MSASLVTAWSVAILTVTAGLVAPSPLGSQDHHELANASDIDGAVAVGDWTAVKRLLRNADPLADGRNPCGIRAPLRLLLGHAALATGENSTAVALFYCPADTTGSEALAAWLNWADDLARRYPASPTARYLRGDALARSGRLTEAVQEFDVSLARDSGYVLAFNARGVSRWLLARSGLGAPEAEVEATRDIIAAIAREPRFADAWATRGVMALFEQADLSRATSFFSRAIAIDSTFWLARNGRACAYGARGLGPERRAEIEYIAAREPEAPFLRLANEDPKFRNSKESKARGQFHGIDIDARLNVGAIAGVPYANLEFGARGGVYVQLIPGENVRVVTGDSAGEAATWFALNYPWTGNQPAR